jgi:DNA-binding CsgD family transcriptional regulator
MLSRKIYKFMNLTKDILCLLARDGSSNYLKNIGLLAMLLVGTISSTLAQREFIDSMKLEIKKAKQKKDKYAEARAYLQIAELQANMGSVFEARMNAQTAIDIFEQLNKPAEVLKAYLPLLVIHHQLHNGDKLIEFSLKGIEIAKSQKDTLALINMLMCAGVGHDEKKEHHKALAYYWEALKFDKAANESTSANHANISSSYTFIGDYEKGIEYGLRALEESKMEKDTDVIILGSLCASLAYLKKGEVEKSDILLKEVTPFLEAYEDRQYERDFMLLQAMASLAKRDYKAAFEHYFKYHTIDSTLSSEQRNAQFAELESIYETKKKENQNVQLAAQVAQQRFWLGAALITLAIGAIFVVQQRKKMKIRATLLETEKTLSETEALRIKEEIRFYQSELNFFTQSLREKNKLIETLQQDINYQSDTTMQTQQSIVLAEEERLKLLHQLTQATILTEGQWREFRQKFERVHHHFFQKLMEYAPEATEAEQRLAALTKLQLSNNEIAAMLGISPESVTKTRYRLNKKLGDKDLEKLVTQI